jgi:intergrase/recombinase
LFDWGAFKQWVKSKYAKSYAYTVLCYAKKFNGLLDGNLAELECFGKSKRGNILRALSALSRYLGIHEQFKQHMKDYGLKWESQSCFDSFLRILNNKNKDDVIEWVKLCQKGFDNTYATFVKFALFTGIRKSEAIEAFNLIVRLSKDGRLSDYYKAELETLEHFRYPDKFIRGTKNVFFSFVKKSFIDEIAKCHMVSESSYKRRHKKIGVPSRIKDLREYFATYMLNHGLLKEEIDLIQGRIGKSIFMKQYFSPAIKDLKDRTLNAVQTLSKIEA